MPKLYIKQKEIISQDTIDFLIEESKSLNFERSMIWGFKGSKISDTRTSTQIILSYLDFPDVTHSLINLGLKLEICDNWQDVKCREFLSLLRYDKGGQFNKHQDVIKPLNSRSRYFSSSILIAKSENLVGGDLILYSDDNMPFKVDLEVGEAVLFHSKRYHEVTEVKQGWRLALVVWLSK